MAKKIPTQDEKNEYHELRSKFREKVNASNLILDQIKMTSFIQMCEILEKENPNDTELGNKIRKIIKTYNQNNNP